MSTTRLYFDFLPAEEADQTRVRIRCEGELPEHHQIWVWGLYYLLTLHQAGDSDRVTTLREILDSWAVQMTSKMFLDMKKIREAGLTTIDPQVVVDNASEAAPQGPGCVLALVSDDEDAWPALEVLAQDELPMDRRLTMITALAQYFLDDNRLFLRELPVHVLAYRKFFTDVRSFTDPRALEEAPLFAFEKALDLFEGIRKTQENQEAVSAAPVTFTPIRKH